MARDPVQGRRHAARAGSFIHAVQGRRPDDGTWCEAWTVRDILVHQTGNAEELARVLRAFLAGAPVETRSFAREATYRRMSDTELWAAFMTNCEQLTEIAAAAAQDLSPDTEVMWTGRSVQVPFFAEHMREELILHRWDLTGDDRTAVRSLNESWMTEHSVVSVGRPCWSGAAPVWTWAPRGGSRAACAPRAPTTSWWPRTPTAARSGSPPRRARPRSRATRPPASSSCGAAAPPTPPAGTAPPAPEALRRVRTLLGGY